MYAPVRRHEGGCPPEHFLMVRQRGRERPMLGLAIVQDIVPAHDPALDLIDDHGAPELDRGPALVPRDHAAMWLEQTHDFLVRRDFAALHHARARLLDHPLDQRDEPLDLRAQAPSLFLSRLPRVLQRRAHPRHLIQGLLGRGDHLLIDGDALFHHRLPLLALTFAHILAP